MNQREKGLMAIVALLLVVILGFVAFDKVSGMFDARQTQITTLDREIRQKEHVNRRGLRDSRTLNGFHSRSLPGDVERARSVYQTWLLELVQDVGLADVQIAATSGRAHRDLYQELRFTVNGQGNLEQLTRLLHRFHGTDILHRIRSLRATPIRESKNLNLVMSVEALSLKRVAADATLTTAKSARLRRESLDDYTAMILNRNLFGPPNNPPRIASVGRQSATRGQTLSLDFKATDADALDRLSYRFLGDPLARATLDERTGKFTWQPSELGEYTVTVRVTDDGYPPRTDEREVEIRVSDPPPPTPVAKVETPPKPKFDFARFTRFSGVTEAQGRAEIWLNVQTTGELLKLHVGDRFAIGSVQGEVAAIGDQFFELQDSDGRTRRVRLGAPLVDDAQLD